MDDTRAYRSTFGNHELHLAVADGAVVARGSRLLIGGVEIPEDRLVVRASRVRGEHPDGRLFDLDVSDGIGTRRGDATLVLDGHIVPLERTDLDRPAGPGRVH